MNGQKNYRVENKMLIQRRQYTMMLNMFRVVIIFGKDLLHCF
jgi:hypothetical protein